MAIPVRKEYGAVPSNGPSSSKENDESRRDVTTTWNSRIDRNSKKRQVITYIGLFICLSVIGGGTLYRNKNVNVDDAATITSASFLMFGSKDHKTLDTNLPMPDGVNIGSWLSLEDYFFAGKSAIEVATPEGDTAAVCLPPLHTGASTGPTWHAETDLLQSLTEQTNLGHALRVFHAYRNSFLDFEEDLMVLKELGIKSIRVPLSWCLTDEDPAGINPKENDSVTIRSLEERFTCQDPFFDDVRWPAIPRSILVQLLQACAVHGIRATLDMHTYPGATSPGTFSGLWPRWPRFWTHGDQPATDDTNTPDIGRQIWRDFVEWIESLDDDKLQGLEALTPMNEPAHLAGIFSNGHGDDPPYLPPLLDTQAREYLEHLKEGKPSEGWMSKKAMLPAHLTEVPDGPHLRVFKWLDDAIDVFRKSTLPSRGISLAVNVHESVLNPEVIPGNDGDDPGGRHPNSMKILAAWWRGATFPKERSSWAILDIHHYHAWEPQCQGASDGHLVANYTCAAVDERKEALNRCASWAGLLRQTVDEECGEGAQIMSGEMSASTHHNVRHACNDISTLRESYLSQVHAAKAANIKSYWWSYKMPFGGAFRPAWSLRHFLWLMGALPRPDESNYPCGDHVAIEGEPGMDDF